MYKSTTKGREISLQISTTDKETLLIDALQIGDYAYHKTYVFVHNQWIEKSTYTVTHLPSNLSVKNYNTKNRARSHAILFQHAPTWNGQGERPEALLRWLRANY